MESTFDNFTINDDSTKTDLDAMHHELANSYWCKNIPKELLKKAIDNSLCFNVYENEKQVAFARVVTDKSTYGYLCDVIVNENYRKRGIGKGMMKFIMDHPELQGLRRFTLATVDAHAIYGQFGFTVAQHPQNIMEIVRRDLYL